MSKLHLGIIWEGDFDSDEGDQEQEQEVQVASLGQSDRVTGDRSPIGAKREALSLHACIGRNEGGLSTGGRGRRGTVQSIICVNVDCRGAGAGAGAVGYDQCSIVVVDLWEELQDNRC